MDIKIRVNMLIEIRVIKARIRIKVNIDMIMHMR